MIGATIYCARLERVMRPVGSLGKYIDEAGNQRRKPLVNTSQLACNVTVLPPPNSMGSGWAESEPVLPSFCPFCGGALRPPREQHCEGGWLE